MLDVYTAIVLFIFRGLDKEFVQIQGVLEVTVNLKHVIKDPVEVMISLNQ